MRLSQLHVVAACCAIIVCDYLLALIGTGVLFQFVDWPHAYALLPRVAWCLPPTSPWG